MPDPKLSFGRHFSLAYEDTFRVLTRMWPVVIVVVVAAIGVQLLGLYLAGLIPTRLGKAGLFLLSGLATAFIIGPYYLVLCRAVATDEVTRNAEPLRRVPAGQRFTAWLMVAYAVVSTPLIAFYLFGPDVPASEITSDNLNPALALFTLVFFVGMVTMSVRLSTLLPMLALDPDNATLPRAFAQTRGRFWWIAGLSFVTLLPLMFADQIVSSIADGLDGPLAYIIGLPAQAAVTGVTVVTAISVSTRLYESLAGR